eukprot:4715630-Pyramimonas_sp.AAC.1
MVGSQRGGLQGKSADVATHWVRTRFRAQKKAGESTLGLFLDLTAALYKDVKQFVLGLPGEEDDLKQALSDSPIPEALFKASMALSREGKLDRV